MRSVFSRLSARLRSRLGQRASGALFALVAEALVVLLLLTMVPKLEEPKVPDARVVSFVTDSEKQSDEKPAPDKKEKDDSEAERVTKVEPKEAPTSQSPTTQQAPPQPEAEPEARPTPWIEISPQQMASTDIAPAPSPAKPAKPARTYGPVADPRYAINVNDTPRVPGSGPNGEPLYAAAWYREPYEDELSGFLSAAKGPGWGLIACKTAPHYRVEDCVKVDEYPEHSGIAQAVLAAAFQFQVRPPRIGGESQVGAWVRIRIDYGVSLRPQAGR